MFSFEVRSAVGCAPANKASGISKVAGDYEYATLKYF
jgi:hypothetical protein